MSTDWDAEAAMWGRCRNVLVACIPREWKEQDEAGNAEARAKRRGYMVACLILSERERAARDMAAQLRGLAAV